MRLTVTVPAEYVVKLKRVAEAAHRPPRYQAETLLWDAIDLAIATLELREAPPVPHASLPWPPSPNQDAAQAGRAAEGQRP